MHYDESLVDLVRSTLFIVLKVSGPILAAGSLIGLLVSLVQSVTSVQDQTLTFVPKIVVMVLVAAMLMHWMSGMLLDFTRDMFALF